jgi:hypothetical protein
MGILAIAAGEATGDLGTDSVRGFFQRREKDEEAEEARCKKLSVACDWKKVKSPKEETS